MNGQIFYQASSASVRARWFIFPTIEAATEDIERYIGGKLDWNDLRYTDDEEVIGGFVKESSPDRYGNKWWIARIKAYEESPVALKEEPKRVKDIN